MWAALFAFLAGVARVVVEWIKGTSTEDLKPSLAACQERVRQLEAELSVDRRRRLQELDEEADAADRAAADELLKRVTGADDPNVN